MTANRDKDADKKATLKVLQAINKGATYKLADNGLSWLGHKEGGAKIDEKYLFGALLPKSDEEQKRVHSHFSHLRTQHGLDVIELDGVYRIVVPK